MLTLGIDTATSLMSIALLKDETILSEAESSDKKNHSANIMTLIGQVLDEGGIDRSQVDLICVNTGPGAFTSLRVGVATANGMAQFGKHPIVAVHSLEVLKESVSDDFDGDNNTDYSYTIPMIDARRKRVFAAIYKGNTLIEGNLDIEPKDLAGKIKMLNAKVILIGNGVQLYNDLWIKELGDQIRIIQSNPCSYAVYTARLGRKSFLKHGDMGLGRVLPNYVRKSDADANI
ncbi:MAG: tRNA (adenosine(37)-N6)-threonylcarbamoyltransferase complex dimerization subunit type 1 TsaB [bacterium]|nr:MAG: tRNA (adenosine(37)-N6)-threonylcarbamoyltransferase complex dimerization subunit type 1 TsaB [bacterium]